ncbi:MAG: hypothetical protein SFX73_00255 [Kofleriaceae bacterium]|nr:hypothetical protein [Kofleriaceae bacterium]
MAVRLDGIELPEGLSAKLVATLVQRQSKEYWSQTKGYFEDHADDCELDYIGFLRWCLLNLPEIPAELWINFAELRQRADCPRAQRRMLAVDETRSVLGRITGSLPEVSAWKQLQLLTELLPAFARDVAATRAAWAGAPWGLLLLVDWLSGTELTDDETALAASLCVEANGFAKERDPLRVLEPLARRPVTCTTREMGRALLGHAGWVAALEARFVTQKRTTLYGYQDMFAARPLEPSAYELAARDDKVDELVAYARARPESGAELLRVGEQIGARPLGELLRLEGIAKLVAAGVPLPKPATELLKLDLRDPAALARYHEVLSHLPERATLLDKPMGITALAATDDQAPLRAQLREGNFVPVAVGALGKRAIDAILAQLGQPCDAGNRKLLEDTLLEAMAAHLASGGAFDEEWTLYVVLGNLNAPAGERIVRYLPEPRRAALLADAIAETSDMPGVLSVASGAELSDESARRFIAATRKRTHVRLAQIFSGNLAELNDDPRSPDAILPTVDRLRARAAAAPGPYEPVYALQIVDDEIADRATTLTGFQPPVTKKPKRGVEHVLTIDLEDAPELAARVPDARAVSLFVPTSGLIDNDEEDEGSGAEAGDPTDAFEGSFWRAWSPTDVAAALRKARKRTLVLHRVLVPSALFAPTRLSTPELAAVRDALNEFPGWLLGGPLTLQEDTEATKDEAFMAQLTEDFGLNVGDAGFLYSYVEGGVWDCL